MRRAFVIALLILLAGTTPVAVAACTLSAPTTMAFGTYTGALYETTSSITVTCGWLSNYSISLSAGNGSGATQSSRTMTGPGALALSYQLFSDSARTVNWANNAPGKSCASLGGCSYTITVYGRIGAGQLVAPGSFADTIVASSTGSSSVNIGISAALTASCAISATNLNFGTYKGAQDDATASLAVTCSNTTPYYVNLNDGQNTGGNWQNNMKGTPGGMLLPYTFYPTAARNTIKWGNTNNYDGVAGVGTGSAQALTVYGRLLGGYYVTPGSYSDTVIATITY